MRLVRREAWSASSNLAIREAGMTEDTATTSPVVVGVILVALFVSLGVSVAFLTADDSSRGRPTPVALLRQSVNRLTQVTRPTLSYDVRLEVISGDQQRAIFSVQGENDEPSTFSTGRVHVSGPGGSADLRFLSQGHRLFLRASDAGESDPWTELDLLAALEPGDGNDLDLLALALQRPTALAALVRGAVVAEPIGEERLTTGVNTNRYRARVAFEKVLTAAWETIDPELLATVTQRIDGEEVELDAWVDANRRLRALSMEGTLDGGRRYTMTLTVREFGLPVTTTLPARTGAEESPDLGRLLATSTA
jgi:hypothetical protein